jgi:hypothetical protein
LAEAGIGKNLAHQARTFAKMTGPAFEQAVQDKRQAVVDRTTRPATKPPSAQPKRATCLELLELWMRLPTTERSRFFDGIGLSAILESIPKTWTEALERWVEGRRCQPQSQQTAKPVIPADLCIPDCLRRSVPTAETDKSVN